MEGWSDVFAVMPDGDRRVKRYHLFRAEPGAVLFGAPEHARCALLAVGGIGSRFAAEPVAAAADGLAIEAWMRRLAAAASRDLSVWPEEVLAAGEVRLTAGRRAASAPHALVWVAVIEGDALLCGKTPLPEGFAAWPLVTPD